MVYLHDVSSDYFVFDQWLHDDLKLDFPELFYFSYQFFYYGESSIIFATCKSNKILPSESCPLYSHLLQISSSPLGASQKSFGVYILMINFGFLFPKDGFQKCKISTIKEISASKYQATRMLNDLSHSLMPRQY